MGGHQADKTVIQRLLRTLKDHIQKQGLTDAAKVETLTSLKSLIISAQAAAVFAQNDVKALCFYAFDQPERQARSSLIALKCLANLLLLEGKTRQYFVDEGYAAAVTRRLQDGPESELLCARILFLLTYDTSFNFEDLFGKESLANYIHENIIAHASQYARRKQKHEQFNTSATADRPDALEPGALTESLKLLFNLNQFYPHHVPDFDRTIAPILEILTNIRPQTPGLQQPTTALINSLLSLNLPGPVLHDSDKSLEYTPLFPQKPDIVYLRLINILDSGIRSSKDDELDALVPLVTLLRRVYELAPVFVKSDMKAKLLPSNEERAQPLGRGDSLASRLLRLSTVPTVPRFEEGISNFLFELSDKDAATFVRNVGYGYAAGYLMTHNLSVPETARRNSSEAMITVDGQEINPITGQRRDMEPDDPLPEMTDEEKEREAERLFVLFERLKATGVMNVVNPVEQAVNEGRFEEVD